MRIIRRGGSDRVGTVATLAADVAATMLHDGGAKVRCRRKGKTGMDVVAMGQTRDGALWSRRSQRPMLSSRRRAADAWVRSVTRLEARGDLRGWSWRLCRLLFLSRAPLANSPRRPHAAMSSKIVLGSALPLLLALWIHLLNDFRPLDVYFPPAERNPAVDDHFSETYYQARALFRQRAKDANAQLHSLPLEHLSHLDLTIDVAVIPGTSNRVLLHVSGTHGVEGFTGSAIQSRILQAARNASTINGPTVVLVHALNPYGFSQLRRANENNVDINRNWLSAEEFAREKATDANANGYADIYEALNPPVESAWMFGKTVYTVFANGFANFKKAYVAGTYHFSEGVLFGGFEKQPSLVIIEEFLHNLFDFSKVKSIAVIDVHTGLGPAGIDTLILMPGCNQTIAEDVFAQEKLEGNVSPMLEGAANEVTDGYGAAKGFIASGLAHMVPAQARAKVLAIGQEFGTIGPLFVIKAVTAENAVYHQAPERRLPYAERLRDAFYVHQSASWRQNIIVRGVRAYEKLHAFLTM